MDPNQILDWLQDAARSVGAEFTSPWFYFQVGLVLIGGGIAYLAGAAIRSRIDLTSRMMGWPAPLRHFLRVAIDSVSTALFSILMALARLVMVLSTWPSRSYLLVVSAKLGAAWLVIRLITSV